MKKDKLSGGPASSGTSPMRRRKSPIGVWVAVFLLALVAGRLLAVDLPRVIKEMRSSGTAQAESSTDISTDTSELKGMSFAEIKAQKLIVDVHEHLGEARLAPMYLKIMDELGIATTCLMGSSQFTLTLNEKVGFTGYDENNGELLDCETRWPGRFEAWTVINPLDGDKLEKFQAAVARGAQGLKLYLGHGYVTKKEEYIFHPIAMDDPSMLPLYAYCQENFIPICIHVNPYEGKKGFAEEFVAILTQFPDMKVVGPHFILSSVQDSRLSEYLDTFPNLYTDISFGDYFMADRLKYISKNPNKFKRIFHQYQDRFMFGTDLVLTEGYNKTEKWIRDQFTAYLDMLSKENYTTDAIPGEILKGVNLSGSILEKVLFKNYHDLIARQPKDTHITRDIDWDRMNVPPTGRTPGQTFPPQKGDKQKS